MRPAEARRLSCQGTPTHSLTQWESRGLMAFCCRRTLVLVEDELSQAIALATA